MAKKKAVRINFRTIEDLHVVPLEKIDAFVTDLRMWLLLSRATEVHGAIQKNRDTFKWVDDGKHDIDLAIKFVHKRGDT